MTVHRPLVLAALVVVLLAGAALAADGGTFTLAPGEVRSVRVGSMPRRRSKEGKLA